MIEEGKAVPKFQLEDADGNLVKSSQLKGQKYVVYFYPRDFTPGCTTEADEFSKDYKKFQKEGIEIIGISKKIIRYLIILKSIHHQPIKKYQ